MADYLIWSNEHGAWWRNAGRGYTLDVALAGLYPRDEAINICVQARGGWVEGKAPPEIPVAFFDAREIERLDSKRRARIERRRK